MPLPAFRLPLAALLLLLFIQTRAQQKNVSIQKQPVWVTQNTISYASDQLDHEAEDGVVDVAYEKQISIAEQTVFTKRVVKLLSEAGVQNRSEISVDFDPAYQHLVFHSIHLIRNGHMINKLELAKIKTVQQEKELDQFIYNGTLSAVLFLEDVQKGDVLEYSYSVKGFNPIFGGRYSGILGTQFSVPIYQIYFKLLCPATRSIVLKTGKTPPVVSTVANQTSYEWRLDNVPALHVENNVPSWYDPYPEIRISEFKNWKEVNDWALGFFPFDVPVSEAVKSKVQEIKRTCKNPESQVAAALRFVQDDIRYMGIEMGENSHKPHQPDQIFRQRFGDCKDKSYLLCTLLRALSISANPVLINTTYQNTIREWLPAPTIFDHCTVNVTLNGKTYWFDPTISFQRGPLQSISYPDYQCGLVITDTTTQLTSIPFRSDGLIRIKEVFDVPGMQEKVHLKVVTAYSGSFADDMRSDFKNTSRYELSKTYTDYYAYYFKKIQSDSLRALDDEKTGVFTTMEYYTIDNLWSNSSDITKASFEPYVINGVLKKPENENRKMPYSLRFPVHYQEEIEVNLPEAWSLDQSTDESEAAAFKLHTDFSCTGKQILLKYDYKNRKDHIASEEVKAYINALNKAQEGIAYSISTAGTSSTAASATGHSNHFTALYLALGLCVFITYNVRKRNRERGY